MVTVLPLMDATVGSELVNVMGSGESDVAVRVKAGSPRVLVGKGLKVMFWTSFAKVKKASSGLAPLESVKSNFFVKIPVIGSNSKNVPRLLLPPSGVVPYNFPLGDNVNAPDGSDPVVAAL